MNKRIKTDEMNEKYLNLINIFISYDDTRRIGLNKLLEM